MKNTKTTVALSIALALAANAAEVMADSKGKGRGKDDLRGGGASACRQVATALGTNVAGIHAALKQQLDAAVAAESSGLNLNMWATLVNRDGVVCAVAFSGANRNAQWPGSRVISAQKANAANAFSLDSLALSTANLYSAVQPGGSLYGLPHSNPVDTEVAYKGPTTNFGRANDPMVGERPGGVNVFGGGMPLYNEAHRIIGAVGLSGDTSCADHNIAWRVRAGLGLDNLQGVAGVSGDPTRADNIVFDISGGASASGFGHPVCVKSDNVNQAPDNAGSQAYANTLPTTDH